MGRKREKASAGKERASRRETAIRIETARATTRKKQS
jgi:hypothetical protein